MPSREQFWGGGSKVVRGPREGPNHLPRPPFASPKAIDIELCRGEECTAAAGPPHNQEEMGRAAQELKEGSIGW
eukprot:scaffold46947_cov22-Tisochrysis_lutea.AAC.3